MSKVIESPVKRFPGTITIPDYLTHPQAIAYWRSVTAASDLPRDTSTLVDMNYALLPGLCACVEKWDIQGLPMPISPETFPATPARPCRQLIQWAFGELRQVIEAADDIPNE